MNENLLDLLKTFPGPYPRYNYYPRMTEWDNKASESEWMEILNHAKGDTVDLYIHFPFCKSFCHFCGCNIKIGTDFHDQSAYIEVLKKELKSYGPQRFKIRNLYFGGGTPNALHYDLMKEFLTFLFSNINKDSDFHFVSEFDLRNYNEEYLHLLKSFGMTGLSFGVQDLNESVLNIIGRKTDTNKLLKDISSLKDLSLDEVSIDLLYGLPKQGSQSFEKLKELFSLNIVNKVSLYPFAEVPWFSDYYPEWDIHKPSIESKMSYFCKLDAILKDFNFEQIGYGHYFKKSSEHYKDYKNGQLGRTVMGYANKTSDILIGAGVSAISISPTMLKKNHKILGVYLANDMKISNSHKMTEGEYNRWKLLQRMASEYQSTELNSNSNIPDEYSRYFIPYISKQYLSEL